MGTIFSAGWNNINANENDGGGMIECDFRRLLKGFAKSGGALFLMIFAMAASASEPVNFVQWRPGFASSAQPDADYLKRAKSLGYNVVINIAPPEYKEAVEKEGAILAAQGITYLNLPVDFGNPTAEDFRVFSDVMKTMARKNVLVHCQVNLRGSSFAFLYRVIHEGASMDEARGKLNSVWVPNATWKKFIESVLVANGKKGEIF
jgi:protein tyrosine phosphatase (PTP) superfamily phosphohydrolase (DUF442 family)